MVTRNARILKCYRDFIPVSEIAHKYRISVTRVYQILHTSEYDHGTTAVRDAIYATRCARRHLRDVCNRLRLEVPY